MDKHMKNKKMDMFSMGENEAKANINSVERKSAKLTRQENVL